MSNDPCLNTALLNFCTKLDNGPKGGDGDRAPPKRTPEEMQWLKDALASIEQPERKIKRLLATLAGGNVPGETYLECLEELSELVEDINWAVEFALGDGHRIVLQFLQKHKAAAESAEVRQSAAMVIAHAAQLNERVQKCFEEVRWQDVLVPMLKKEDDPAVIAALLHSCSCLCRDYVPNAQLFERVGGVNAIIDLLDAESIGSRSSGKVIKRTLFFLAYLVETVKVDARTVAYRVVQLADNNDDEIQSAAARTLAALAVNNGAIVREAIRHGAPECLARWRNAAFDGDDGRRQLVRVLEAGVFNG
uniref:Nucleotide exchange factor Fes1 domain-containing protein n=1 Tax=Trypanosoma congolense (strain IL3000) TaxID=1068625 RepID=G0ULF9_TRYCI|nr:conserved hypothetical protein [Trypanosoma congolense IL3000]